MKRLFATTVGLSLTVSGLAQERTLRAIVEEQDGPVNLVTKHNFPTISLADLTRESDLIVRGTVTGAVSYLSPDETDIYTDLTLSNVRFLLPAATKQPGPTPLPPPLIVTQLGGTVSINGHQVRSSHRNLPPIKAGTDALLFLTWNNDKLFIAMRYLGVFAIENDRIIPLTQTTGFAAQVRGRRADDFVRDVLALPTAVRPAK